MFTIFFCFQLFSKVFIYFITFKENRPIFLVLWLITTAFYGRNGDCARSVWNEQGRGEKGVCV